ncbi:restriction endonuclease [Vibrio parahaemolyticus]|nr:restriction endonuclease [Vibrio parahaemolyticus]
MHIDFSEITNDHAFENFCMHLLELLGFTVPTPPAIGPDGGRDIICEEPSKFAHARGYRWLVSCKHYAGSGRSIGVSDDAALPHKLIEHDCDGFLFMCSTAFTEGFRTSTDNVCRNMNSQYHMFNSYDLENTLLSSPRFYPLIHQYFPNSHNLLVGAISELPCCDRLYPQSALFSVYEKNQLTNMVTCRILGECCFGDYCEHLEQYGIEYSHLLIKNPDW